MYEISVRTEFSAAHALSISGIREPIHGHNWHVTVVIAGRQLDPDGLLCDFHTVEDVLAEITEPLDNNDLNRSELLAGINPSAENLARRIAEELGSSLNAALAPHAWIDSVSVTEAPGCCATYRPEGRNPTGT
jgi:6-pyruvoyltetrahydropterin/6-carboxytetrahydropterin synthase